MARRRPCAVSNHEGEQGPYPSRRGEGAAPQDEDIVVATNLELELLRFIRFPHVQAPCPALARETAHGDRRDRRAGPRPVDGARRYHRPADTGEADPGSRLRVPPGTRGRHDAPAG